MSVTYLLLMRKLEKTNQFSERMTVFCRRVEIHTVGRYRLNKTIQNPKRFSTKKILRISPQRQIPLFTEWITDSVKWESSYVKWPLGRY